MSRKQVFEELSEKELKEICRLSGFCWLPNEIQYILYLYADKDVQKLLNYFLKQVEATTSDFVENKSLRLAFIMWASLRHGKLETKRKLRKLWKKEKEGS